MGRDEEVVKNGRADGDAHAGAGSSSESVSESSDSPGSPAVDSERSAPGADAASTLSRTEVVEGRRFLAFLGRHKQIMKWGGGVVTTLLVIGGIAALPGDVASFFQLVFARSEPQRVEAVLSRDGVPIDRLPTITMDEDVYLEIATEPETHLAVVVMKGDGRIESYQWEDLEPILQKVGDDRWSIPWVIEGPPEAETVLVLASRRQLDGNKIRDRISKLDVAPVVDPDRRIHWSSDGWAAREAMDARGPNFDAVTDRVDMSWADAVHAELSRLDGIGVSGWTVPVVEERDE